jgi:predicted RNA-binding Zn-ribbon protein involved in translation (DUF1610 family)
MAKRPRTERRVEERRLRGLVRDREKLFLLEAGGSAARPIDVASSSVIDVKWRAMPCPQCGGSLVMVDERAEDAMHRSTDVRCAECGSKRTLYFRIVPTAN